MCKMCDLKRFIKFCISFLFAFPLINARKYNIEEESSRIYGEEFKTVLQKFRKTPDYLQILEEKYDEMLLFFGEVATYALQYTMDNRLKSRVADACGFEEMTITSPAYYLKAHIQRRKDAEETLEVPRSPIDLLEQYSYFSNVLTTRERNRFRDLAFEITGEMIHMIIRSMGPVDLDSVGMSTRLSGDSAYSTNKEHDHIHFISPSTKAGAPANSDY